MSRLDALKAAASLIADWMEQYGFTYRYAIAERPKVQIVMPSSAMAWELQRALRHASSAEDFDFGTLSTDNAAAVRVNGFEIEFVGPSIDVKR